VCIEFLAEAGVRWDQFGVRWKCIPGTWPGDGKGFVSYMRLTIRETTTQWTEGAGRVLRDIVEQYISR